MMRWLYQQPSAERLSALQNQPGLTPLLAHLLAGMDDLPVEAVNGFLNPRLADLDCPLRLKNMDAAVDRLCLARERSETVAVVGDYDVDGVTSTALMVSVLRHYGLSPDYYLPRRQEEGYGLSGALIDRVLHNKQPTLLIALDCGTTAVGEVARLRALGIDVIIVDHHRSKEHLPEAAIMINPHVHDEPDQPWTALCTVGLVFKLAHALTKVLRQRDDALALALDLREHLDLVVLGTVADMVPLLGENRTLASHGLKSLLQTRRPGLRALFAIAGLEEAERIAPSDIAFRLGPRINAGGRLADAGLPLEMMLCEELERCKDYAATLDQMNRERQEIERGIFFQALQQVEAGQQDAPGLVVYGEDWHPGVVGIVAGKIARQYNRPAIVLGREGEDAKGSGRGVAGVNLVKALQPCASLLGNWGGHPLAVGVGLPIANVDAFRQAFVASVAAQLGADLLPEPELSIACWLLPEELDEQVLLDIEQLGPFGEGNPEPVVGVKGVVLTHRPDVFGEGHCRFRLSAGPVRRIHTVGWRMAPRIPEVGRLLDLALSLNWNYWQGRRTMQAQLIDWRHSEESS
jgi:single-stranded-DNA-specific exonuclease